MTRPKENKSIQKHCCNCNNNTLHKFVLLVVDDEEMLLLECGCCGYIS